MIDLHLHTSRCCHASGTMEEYVEEARRKGLKIIGFADHFPLGLLGYEPRVQVTMEPRELVRYIEEVRRLNGENGDLTIRIGIEVDYIPGLEDKTRDLLSFYPFDYVIGSLHFMEGWDFTHPKYAEDYRNKNLGELYEQFFDLTAQLCRSKLFDIIGHIDVIKKFGFRPESDLEPFWRRIAKLLKENNLCTEINTAGKDAPVGEFYPDRRFLEICREEEVPVTIGSDAHAPEQVGRYLPEAIEALKKAGYGEVALFELRERSFIPL